MVHFGRVNYMRTMSAKDTQNTFGVLFDRIRATSVQVEKHGRPVVVSVEEFQRMSLTSGATFERTGN